MATTRARAAPRARPAKRAKPSRKAPSPRTAGRAKKDPLRTYREKRDPAKTPEPFSGKPADIPRFVVQKHDATRLHYDVRLEVEGVMPSWAVPKGPSLDPAEKRLAMRTEDHPLDYMFFEGVIPEGEYGAGPVIVWDIGVYQNLDDKPVAEGLRKGHVKVWLQGKKLEGGWALTRVAVDDGKERWIMVKKNDDKARAGFDLVAKRPESVVTGRRIEDLASDEPERKRSFMRGTPFENAKATGKGKG